MEPQKIYRGGNLYPAELGRCLGDAAPTELTIIGNVGLLKLQLLGLFCSIKCPGSVILQRRFREDW